MEELSQKFGPSKAIGMLQGYYLAGQYCKVYLVKQLKADRKLQDYYDFRLYWEIKEAFKRLDYLEEKIQGS